MTALRAEDRGRWRALLAVCALAGLYLLAAKLGLRLAFLHPSATPVWPPAGIALAAILLYGPRMWPGVFAGAFLANMTTAGTVWTSAAIATGNTLEALVGAWLVGRFAGGLRAFDTPRTVFRFAAFAGLASTLVSATLGVASLALGGFLKLEALTSVWFTWWLGDVGGDLVIAPVLLLLPGSAVRLRGARDRIGECAVLLAVLVLAGLILLSGVAPWATDAPLFFLAIPPLVWAAFRFSQLEAAIATALLSGFAIKGVLNGHGPFNWGSPTEALLILQAFMGVIGVTTLALSAAVAERRRAESALARTAAIVESSGDAIVSKTLDGLITSWNAGAERLYGYTLEEVVGRPVSILAPSEREDEIPEILSRVRRGESVEHYQTERLRKDGRRVIVSLRVSPIRDGAGAIVGASAIARDITEQKEGVDRLLRLEKAVETIPIGVTITDPVGRILYTNAAEAETHGYRIEELIGRHVSVFMPQVWEPAPGRPSPILGWKRETVNVRQDGTIFPVQLVSNAVNGADGEHIGIVTCCEEITERKLSEEALRSSEERYRLLFERNLAGVYRATLEGRILECNEAFRRILGYSSEAEVLALTAWDLFFDRADREASLARLRNDGSLTNFELRLRRRDGSGVWVLENETLLRPSDGDPVVVGTLIDITRRKAAEEQVEFDAHHDPLTRLPNRGQILDRLHLQLGHARRSGRGMAVMFLDLDHFKAVNDTLGHALGDRLLAEVANRLRACVREEDIVGRMGGDEFVLLLPRVRQGDRAARIARTVLGRIGAPFVLDGHELHITASIGIAVFPQDGRDQEALLKNADAAMYRAKQQGRNTFKFHDPIAPRLVSDRLGMRTLLRHALDRDQMTLLYQPSLDLTTSRIVGTEALPHWRHPTQGTLPPSDFVPMAEDLALIVPIGEWALREACRDGAAWSTRGLPPLRVSLNVSGHQLRSLQLRRTIEEILTETGFPANRLELEVTERAAMQDFDVTAPALRDLAALGLGLAIDEFGSGYFSLSRLKLLPIRRLKIDRSFVAGIGRERGATAIVEAIVRMAQSLDLGIVAEGVETKEQMTALQDLRCAEAQGRFVSEALPEPDFTGLLGSRM